MFDIENLSTKELIEKWNEYCGANCYDDEIHHMHGIRDFAATWYGSDGSVSLDKIEELVSQLSDYKGEDYFYWSNGNACWLNDPNGDDSPIDMPRLIEFLEEEYGAEGL